MNEELTAERLKMEFNIGNVLKMEVEVPMGTIRTPYQENQINEAMEAVKILKAINAKIKIVL